ncbi:hypothetical protein J1N10_08310 [Carboxylicivirga sp. A043]|uniref:DUF5689 domain-containing protein n=1 Tax=Carboxylicivirga litoralis TaxID=2816963 RepID=UPI0021CB3A4A|nr:DUF5689 domain-containing protein [Carboxylicivirga sp. A043]MCU4155977.1 hypothetical protein [Carboxylicivirga sp. A043]
MKLRKYSLFVLTLIVGVFTACDKRDYDVPPITAPIYKGEATHTIKEFKEQFTDDYQEIDYHVVISGIVTANDESGNLYKKMIIQDDDRAIEIGIDKNSIYNTFRVGQKVFIECEGLYTGTYGDKQLIGYKYQSNGEWTVGRMPAEIFEQHVFRHDFPGDKPTPEVIKIANLEDSMKDKLVTLENVKFTQGGQVTFADDSQNSTSRAIVDVDGKSIITYNSKYANFANKTLPKGWGTLTGIMSKHRDTWQLVIRDTLDIGTFIDDGTDPTPDPDTPVTTVDEDFESAADYDPANINGWSVVSVLGDRDWQIRTYSDNYYAQASAHNGAAEDYEYWLITPLIDFDNATNKVMSFETAKSFWKSTSSLEVYVLDSKEIANADLIKLDVTLAQESDGDNTFIPSGDVDLSAQTGQKYIGFKYVAKGGSQNSTTFRIDNFKFGIESGGEEPDPVTPVTTVSEDFESGNDYDPASINNWTVAKVLGDRDWQIRKYTDNASGTSNNYAQASAHNGNADDYEYWLITPAIDMDNATNKTMSFETAKAYWNSTSSLEVYVMDGTDPAAATVEQITSATIAQESDADHTFVASGNVDLSAQTGTKYIGFKYVAKGGASNSTTFRIDNFKFGVAE